VFVLFNVVDYANDELHFCLFYPEKEFNNLQQKIYDGVTSPRRVFSQAVSGQV